MNKLNRDNRYKSVDGVRGSQRRSLRDKKPLSDGSVRRKNNDSNGRRIDGFKSRRISSQQSASAQEVDKPPRPKAPAIDSVRNKQRSDSRRHGFLRYLIPFRRKNLKRASMIFGVLFLVVGGFFAWKIFNAANAVIDERGQSALGLSREVRPEDLTEEGSARINILLIGVPGKPGYAGRYLNDVTMVLSIDPASEDASLLSIPRDLVVDIEDYGLNKINAAHSFGEFDDTTTGPKLLEKTVEDVLDININYYARVDFDGFVDTVDILGGVTVDVKEPLYDASIDSRYGEGGVFSLPAGTQKLDGLQALQYVRCRKGTCGNDFGRAARQQQVLQVIREEVLSTGTFANPRRISALLDQLSEHFRTDISVGEGLQLYELTRSYGPPRSFVLNNQPDNFLGASSVIGGGLAPTAGHLNFSEIQRFVRGDLFRDGFLKRENAPITVLNGTTVPALASELEIHLDGLGYNLVEVDNAPEQTIIETVIYQRQNTEHEFTSHLLSKRIGVPIIQGIPEQYKQFKGDYIVVIGSDYDAV